MARDQARSAPQAGALPASIPSHSFPTADRRPQSAKSSAGWRSAVALGFMIGFTSLGHRTAFGVLYPAMVADRGWTTSEITAAFSIAMLIYSPAGILIGHLLDRAGVRFTILTGSVILAAGLALIGLTTEIWQIYVLYAIAVGIGGNAVGYIAMLKLLSLRAGSRLGTAIGVFNVGQGVGSLLGAPIIQFTVDQASWRAGFFVLGAAALLALFPLAFVSAPGRAESRGESTHGRTVGLRVLIRQPVFWLVLLCNSAIGYLLLLPAHQVAHLMGVGLPDLLAASAGGLFGAFIGLGALAGGWAIDHWGTGRLGVVGGALLGLGILALLASSPALAGLAVVYAVAGGLGRGAIGVNIAAFQARTFAGPALGRVAGLLDLGFGVGAFAGPYLVALSRDLTGSYVPGLATTLVAIIFAASCPLVAGWTLQKSPGALR